MRKEREIEEMLLQWACSAFCDEEKEPEVEILSLDYDEEEDLWEAEIFVSTCPDDLYVTFWTDDHHFLRENRLHIECVEPL